MAYMWRYVIRSKKRDAPGSDVWEFVDGYETQRTAEVTPWSRASGFRANRSNQAPGAYPLQTDGPSFFEGLLFRRLNCGGWNPRLRPNLHLQARRRYCILVANRAVKLRLCHPDFFAEIRPFKMGSMEVATG